MLQGKRVFFLPAKISSPQIIRLKIKYPKYSQIHSNSFLLVNHTATEFVPSIMMAVQTLLIWMIADIHKKNTYFLRITKRYV
ncbi:hypothetical protein PRBRB14_08580 [Hallella multisaccharivorax DSM 17128]|nr:hypothetical protein PRBRB14_08580 [Hallella multisaccharivorax DSM 17128]